MQPGVFSSASERSRTATRFAQSRAEGHTISGNTWEISLPKTRIHTLEELMKFCEVDLSTWEIDRFVVNKWEVGATPKATGSGSSWAREDSGFVVEPLYQVKAWLKRRNGSVCCAR